LPAWLDENFSVTDSDAVTALRDWDAQGIINAVMAELCDSASSSEGYNGSTLSIILPMDHLQHHHLLEITHQPGKKT
jgi:hypothetical protein